MIKHCIYISHCVKIQIFIIIIILLSCCNVPMSIFKNDVTINLPVSFRLWNK